MKRGIRCLLLCLIIAATFAVLINGCGGGGSGGGGSAVSSGGGGSGSNTSGPVITSVTNSQGTSALAPGDEIIISGSGFGSSKSLRDGDQSYVSFVAVTGGSSTNAGTYVSWSDTQIRCQIPGLSSGQNYVVVVNVVTASGTLSSSSTSTTSNTITVNSGQAQVTSISPSTVNQGANVPIYIYGSNFGSSGNVTIGSYNVNASIWSSNFVVATTPSGLSLGASGITVNPTGATTSNSQTLNVVNATAPTIQYVNPSSALQGVSTPLTITGTNLGALQGTGYVKFGAYQQTSITSWGSTQIICNIPASLPNGTYAVSVVTDTGAESNTSTLTIGNVTGKFYALFIGINDYMSSSINDLEGPVNDINGMKNNTLSSVSWSGATVVTLQDFQATKSAIHEVINYFVSQVTSEDTFLFFYSGHGSNSAGHAYIVPTDTDLSTATMIQDDELYGWLSLLNSGSKKCVFIDSCYSGGFINKAPGKSMTPRFVAIPGSSKVFDGPGFPRKLESLANFVFLGACKGSELAYEGNVNGGIVQGYFTYYLMEGLGTGASPGPAAFAGIVSGEGLFDYAGPKTQTYSGSAQNPVTQDNYQGNLELKR